MLDNLINPVIKSVLKKQHFQYSEILVNFVNENKIIREDIVGISGVGRFGEGMTLFYFEHEIDPEFLKINK